MLRWGRRTRRRPERKPARKIQMLDIAPLWPAAATSSPPDMMSPRTSRQARPTEPSPRKPSQAYPRDTPVLHPVPLGATRLTPPPGAAAAASSYVVIPATGMTGLTVSRKERGPLVTRTGSPRRFEHLPYIIFSLLVCLRRALKAVDTRDEGTSILNTCTGHPCAGAVKGFTR